MLILLVFLVTPLWWSRVRPKFVGDYQHVIKCTLPKCVHWFIMCYLRGCLTYFRLNYYYYYHYLQNIIIIIYTTNDFCNSIKHSRHLFADDIKIYRTVSSAVDCTLLQSDTDSIRGWCAANCMILNIDKTPVITFTK